MKHTLITVLALLFLVAGLAMAGQVTPERIQRAKSTFEQKTWTLTMHRAKGCCAMKHQTKTQRTGTPMMTREQTAKMRVMHKQMRLSCVEQCKQSAYPKATQGCAMHEKMQQHCCPDR